MSVKYSESCPLGNICEKHKFNDNGQIIETITCAWLINITGEDPGTGEKIDKKQCAMACLPMMLHESAKMQMRTGASIDDFKNEMVAANSSSQKLLIASMQFPTLHLEN